MIQAEFLIRAWKKTVVAYDTQNVAIKDGVIKAIEEYKFLTNSSIQIRRLVITENEPPARLCRRIVEHHPDFLIDASSNGAALADVVKKLGLPTISASLRMDQWYKSGIKSPMYLHLKSPSRVLIESVRDIIYENELEKPYLRILYDQDYGKWLHGHIVCALMSYIG